MSLPLISFCVSIKYKLDDLKMNSTSGFASKNGLFISTLWNFNTYQKILKLNKFPIFHSKKLPIKKILMKNKNQTMKPSSFWSRTRGSSAGHLIALNCYVKLGCSPLYHWASLTMWCKSLGICYLHTSTSQLNLKDKPRYMLFPVDGDWRK